jgi:hypothetical protein
LGGLHVGRSEPGGIECARSDLEFCFCEADHDMLSTWSELLRSRLIKWQKYTTAMVGCS